MAIVYRQLAEWWQARLPSERKLMGGGGLLVLVSACYWLLLPAWGQYAGLQRERDSLLQDLDWLYQQASIVRQLQGNGCAPLSPSTSSTATDSLETLLRRLQIRGARVSSAANGFSIVVDPVEGNLALRLVRELACAGFTVANLHLLRNAGDQGGVRANLELRLDR